MEARASGRSGCGRRKLPFGGGSVWCFYVVGGEVDTTLPFPGKVGGHRKRVLEPHRGFIVERINQMPHLSLHGLKTELAARGVKVSHDTVWQFLRREGLRFKKKKAVRP